MTGSWEFWDEDPAPESRAHLSYYSKGRSDCIYFHDSPGETVGELFADALNVHEATGLTPSQLQTRVAELEAALDGAALAERAECAAMAEAFKVHGYDYTGNFELYEAIRDRKNLGFGE